MKASLALLVAALLLSACVEGGDEQPEANSQSVIAEPQYQNASRIDEARPTPASVPLDDLLGFADPYRCTTNGDFRALLNGLIHWEEVGETYRGVLQSPPVPARFRAQVGTPRLTARGSEYRVTLPLRGTWQGLPLQSLVFVAWVESESGFYLVFDATREQVLQAANRAGLRLPASGSEYREEEVLGVNVGVKEHEGTAALYCVAG